MFKRYLLTILFCLVGVLSAYYANYRYLNNTGEVSKIEDVVNAQISYVNEGKFPIVGFVSNSADINYKLSMYNELKPQVVAVGSSRVMEFKDYFFSTSFYNTGGAVRNIPQLEYMLSAIVDKHIPDVVIIGLDNWMFFLGNHEQVYTSENLPRADYDQNELSIERLRKPFKLLLKSKISTDEYMSAVFSDTQNVMEKPRIGLRAKSTDAGFAPDGSWLYSNIVTGTTVSIDEKFAYTIEAIKAGKEHYAHGQAINENLLKRLVVAIDALQKKVENVYVFFPPFSPVVQAELNKYPEKYRYSKRIREALVESGVTFYDYQDPTVLGSSGCEFLDAHHGGELTYSKIVEKLATDDPKRALVPFINKNKINAILGSYRDIAMFPDARIHSGTEIDFLKLGCRKELGPDIQDVEEYYLANINQIGSGHKSQRLGVQSFLDLVRKAKSPVDYSIIREHSLKVPGLVNRKEPRTGLTALMIAAREVKSVDLVKVLLELGAVVDATNLYMTTALHMAAHDGLVDITTLLVNAGANMTKEDISGNNALGYAKIRGHQGIYEFLEEKSGTGQAMNPLIKVVLEFL